MNYRIIFFFQIFFLISCTNQMHNKTFKTNLTKTYYLNKGFGLVYNDDLYKKKIINNKLEDRSLIIFQKNLKKNTTVKITNLINSKYLLAKVGKKSDYPFFYNSVISQRISKDLEIDDLEPYIEIKVINETDTFTANKAKTYDEEKKVAITAPVDEIQINVLSNTLNKKKTVKKPNFSYTIKIADFYFKESATQMKSRILVETSIKNVNVKKLSNTEFRVFLGPYNDLNSLKRSFNAINVLQFENIEIIKE